MVPAAGDKVVVRPVFQQHLILNNMIDSVPDPSKVTVDFNRTGMLLWVARIDTVVAGNTIRHRREAIRIQASAGGERLQGANHVRGNTIADCLPGGPYKNYSAFFADLGGGPLRAKDQFHGVGNVFRDNDCRGAEVGVAVGASGHDRIQYPRNDTPYERSAKTGLMHTIVENNRITGVTGTAERPNLGLAISLSANWTLLRNNQLDREPNLDFYLPEKIFEAWCLQGERRWTSEEAAKPQPK